MAPAGASVIFRLQAAAEAPLVDLGCIGRDRFHVVANMGAGHMLRIRCVAYPDEQPEPLRGGRWLLVGGDVTILMDEETDLTLEADPLAAVRRGKREVAEARRSTGDGMPWMTTTDLPARPRAVRGPSCKLTTAPSLARHFLMREHLG